MKRKTFTILFFIKKTKQLKNGEAPVYLRITVDGLRAEMAVKRSVLSSNWDEKKGRAKQTSTYNRALNQYLESIRHNLYSIQKDLEDENKIVTAELLKNRYLGNDTLDISFVNLYTEHNQKLIDLIGKGVAKATITRHETSMKHFVNFLQHKYKKDDILLRDITANMITEYEHYLRTVRNCANNTTIKYIKNVNKIFNLAQQKDFIKKNPISGMKFKTEEVNKDFLQENELKTLLKKEFVSERLNQIRDVFVFCCFTGLAFVDIKQLRKDDFITDNEGNILIRKQRQKTGVWYMVPLLPVAKQILDKYLKVKLPNGQLLPVPSNQKMNAYLKEIADICGIKKNLTTHVARHTFATTVTLANNISIESVSKMLGHTDIKMTQHYAKVLEKTVVREMTDLSARINF